MELCTKIWWKYNEAKTLDEVPRGGIVVCGTGKVQPKSHVLRGIHGGVVGALERGLAVLGKIRLETDGGHTFGLLVLANLVYRYFSDLLPWEIWCLVNEAGIYHEIDELEFGDMLDDGSQIAEQKNQQMAEATARFFEGIPNADAVREIIEQAEKMKNVSFDEIADYYKPGQPATWIRTAAWWLKALDKVEAVLQNGRYKMMDAVGHIGNKPVPSARDAEVVEELGTDDIVFVWAWASAGYLRGTVLWEILVAMMLCVYDECEIPSQFLTAPD